MNIAPDKKLHLIAGTIVAVATLFLGFPQWAIATTLVAGLAKEAHDIIKNKIAASKGLRLPHSVELWDVFYTIAPGALVTLIWLGIQYAS